MCADTPETHSFLASDEFEGERLDRYLSEQFETMSRSRLKALIKAGHISLGGETIIEPNYRVKPGDAFDVLVPAAEPAIPKAENIPLDIVFEDDAVIVIDKPAGLVVHPAAGNWSGTLVNALIGHCGDSLSGIGGVKRPGIVHRIDKDTSGLMVVAKSDVAHKSLTEQFADHGRTGALERLYKAFVWGVPRQPKGSVDAPLARRTTNRQKMAVVAEGGKHAITHYEYLESYGVKDTARQTVMAQGVASLIQCRLETGRTHQIRVHLAHIGLPLIGDSVYGPGFKSKANILSDDVQAAISDLGRQALHASTLRFEHPLTGEVLDFKCEFPKDLKNLQNALSNIK